MNYSETNRVLSWVLRDTQEMLNSFLKEFYNTQLNMGVKEEKTAHEDIWMARLARKKQAHSGSLHCLKRLVTWRLIWEDFVSRSIFKNRKYTTTLFSLMKPTEQNLIKYGLWLWKYARPHSGKRSRINSLANWNYTTQKYLKNHAFGIREAKTLNLFMSLILMIPIIMAVI